MGSQPNNNRTTHHSKWVLGSSTQIREAFPLHPALFFTLRLAASACRHPTISITLLTTLLLTVQLESILGALLTTIGLVAIYFAIYLAIYSRRYPHLPILTHDETTH